MGKITIRPMMPADGDAVLRIYQAGIDTGEATFETAAPAWAEFDSRRLPEHRFVAVNDSGVVGWVAVTPYSSRAVYAGVVEHGVYVDPEARGSGIGRALLRQLIESTEAAGIWTIQSAVFPENVASMTLHERAGFRVWGCASASPSRMGGGGTWSCLSAAVRWSEGWRRFGFAERDSPS